MSLSDLTALKPPTKVVTIHHHGAEVAVRVRCLPLSARAQIRKLMMTLGPDGKPAIRADLDLGQMEILTLVEGIVDDNGQPCLSAEQANALDPRVADQLLEEIRALSGMSEDAAEEIAKNSAVIPSSSSATH